ncbi:hypothetical protein BS47DRAFT_1373606 [Hydnum rufescens UP504]|uniref:Uncharacterized protein n=1 Tax=Hydnum rufescens UP504 TaxID=1448309 RepID=A0A9P6APX1_9AGAM|nr:hypothetical protein BS47DRAFT_1373606 [Hydnum rufescens UP504]
MEKFECWMVQYHGYDLEHHEPSLRPGEKCVITQFHDESCFHANEFKKSAWLKEGTTVLQKKSCGHLIHVSDSINEEDGRLIQHNDQGQTIQDAWKIIYPGAAGDAWWDTAQLLTQVANAIDIFNVTHPECEALFIFDQSSTHALLGPNALHPFKMNKGNGGKQCKQSDTVILDYNPDISLCGKVQKMTTDSGAARGLQTVLEENGMCQYDIFLLSKPLTHPPQYWGYSKYHYCEAFKVTFADAKATAMDSLESCPLDTIHHFINHAGHFMSAYCQGLTGRAAEWAVKKQHSHRCILRCAMLAIESILNT